MKKLSQNKKGFGGLSVLLGVITMLFVIGLLVMIFALMGGELRDEAQSRSLNTSIVNESASVEAVTDLAVAGFDDVTCGNIAVVENTTEAGIVTSGNYTVTGCTITNTTTLYSGDWNVTYSYTYDVETTASSVITNTSSSISGVTGWFPIIIVISAMVTLILLVVIIITAIRGSGLIGGGGASQQGNEGRKGGNVGTA